MGRVGFKEGGGGINYGIMIMELIKGTGPG